MGNFEKRQIGPYRIESRIGRGGMGDVFLARHERLNRRCALKILRPELSADQVLRERFIREAQAAARLEHPNIVTIYDAGEVDGTAYFAMQFVDGEPLSTLIQTGRVGIEEAVAILRDVASALDSAHGSGMVHRDVKPANIIVTREGRGMLTDFGIVHLRPEAQLTTTGQLLGTPAYMSPEQITGGEITAQTDIYQLGVVAYEMLTGTLPFRATEPASLLVAHLQEPPVPLQERGVEVPAETTTVVNRALHKLPAERHQTATEFVDALEATLGGAAAMPQAVPDLHRPSAGRFDETTVSSRRLPSRIRHVAIRGGIISSLAIAGILALVGIRALLADDGSNSEQPDPTGTPAFTSAVATGVDAGTAPGSEENTDEIPGPGEIIASFDASELWPPELDGAVEFEEDGTSRVRLEAPDASATKQTLGANFSNGSAYLEASMMSVPETYAEQCLLARINASATTGYALCLTSDAETFAFYFDDEHGEDVRVELLEPMLRTGPMPPSDWNAMEIRARDDQFWFLMNDVLLGAVRHDGPRSGEIGVSIYRAGSQSHTFGIGVLATLEIE